MGLNWIKDFDGYSVNCLLLLEERQIEWIDKDRARKEWAKVFQCHEAIGWYFANKAPSVKDWVQQLLNLDTSDVQLQSAEKMVLRQVEDWLIYVTDPSVYHNLRFVSWDERELTDLCDFDGKRIIDVGSGTGKQAFAVARDNNIVYCVEPVGNLRKYLLKKAEEKNLKNFFVTDGIITQLPFEDNFADVTMGGHVYGDFLESEYEELMRVTKKGGMVILIPGNNDVDNDCHTFLIQQGFAFGRFEEPGDGMKRKYWKRKE